MRNPHNSVVSIVLLSTLMGFSIACSHRSSSDASRPSDEKITKDIQDKVAADPETQGSEVKVASKEGKVKLRGKVKTPTAQKKVEQIANEEPGIAGVEDETTVESEAASSQAPAPVAAAPPPVEKPKPQPIVVPAGTVLTVTTGQALSSKTSQTGQTFLATLAQPLSVDGRPALPRGATVSGTVVNAKAKGKIKGAGELSLALTSVSVGGHTYPIQTAVLGNTTKGKGKRTAATTGGGAAGGALIGGIAGGGKGAGIGALVGATAGFIGGSATGNKQIELPAESALSFTLEAPLTLPPPQE
jgi:hypothetical protein